ncbi:MAG: trehalose-phosphatase [Candidatus Nanopelagicales bacterium]
MAHEKPLWGLGASALYETEGLADDLARIDTSGIDPELRLVIRKVARTENLLVASDFDGTLAPIVSDPTAARALPGTNLILRNLAHLKNTSVALLSGRALRDLAAMTRLPQEIILVGSHGAEHELGAANNLGQELFELRQKITMQAQKTVASAPGAEVEHKPAGVAVHVRNATEEDSERVLAELHALYDNDPKVHQLDGKAVLELSVVSTNKGTALNKVRDDAGATATIFIGDDVTDETAFAVLGESDLGIKVGQGNSLAEHRVEDPTEVLNVLAALLEERRAWLDGVNATLIEDHTLLADGTDLALLTPKGSIAWLCHPNPDAPAIFAGLLGDDEAGHFTIRPIRDGRPLNQSYLGATMIVNTEWAGVTVTDYLDTSMRDVPGMEHELRLIRVISGTTPVTITFAPRPQFGAVPVRLEPCDEGIRVDNIPDPLVLVAPGLEWDITYMGAHPTARATINPSDGDFVVELRAGTEDMSPSMLPEPQRRDNSREYWNQFAARLFQPRLKTWAVIRSALTLKALCHTPTGAVLAAATTSLPEWIGGIRNWDYRYCWLRDAAMTVEALALLGSTSEADSYIEWIQDIFTNAAGPDRVHPLYALDGSQLGPEAVVEMLPGYAGSRPVRIGNAAQGQVQLDVFGPICSMLVTAAKARGAVTPTDIRLVSECVEAVERRWEEADHGIWEIRDEPRKHVHSRVMCWVAVTKAIELLEMGGHDADQWYELANTIRDDVLANGWDEELGTFVSAYGRKDVDAACLAVITSGMVDGLDPKATGTIAAVEASLRDGPTVYRYRHDDGLPGTEGGMHICTSWLIEAYIAGGKIDTAENLFRQMISCRGGTGLLSEMYNVSDERGLGNHPQAYSHIGVIRTAIMLDALRS